MYPFLQSKNGIIYGGDGCNHKELKQDNATLLHGTPLKNPNQLKFFYHVLLLSITLVTPDFVTTPRAPAQRLNSPAAEGVATKERSRKRSGEFRRCAGVYAPSPLLNMEQARVSQAYITA